MDGEEDEMTRDEMRYLLRGGVVLYYFPFFIGGGKGFFLVNTSIKKIQLKYQMMISFTLISSFRYMIFLSKKKQKTSCHHIPRHVDIQDR